MSPITCCQEVKPTSTHTHKINKKPLDKVQSSRSVSNNTRTSIHRQSSQCFVLIIIVMCVALCVAPKPYTAIITLTMMASLCRHHAHFVLCGDEVQDNAIETALVQFVARETASLMHAAHVLHQHLPRETTYMRSRRNSNRRSG